MSADRGNRGNFHAPSRKTYLKVNSLPSPFLRISSSALVRAKTNPSHLAPEQISTISTSTFFHVMTINAFHRSKGN